MNRSKVYCLFWAEEVKSPCLILTLSVIIEASCWDVTATRWKQLGSRGTLGRKLVCRVDRAAVVCFICKWEYLYVLSEWDLFIITASLDNHDWYRTKAQLSLPQIGRYLSGFMFQSKESNPAFHLWILWSLSKSGKESSIQITYLYYIGILYAQGLKSPCLIFLSKKCDFIM